MIRMRRLLMAAMRWACVLMLSAGGIRFPVQIRTFFRWQFKSAEVRPAPRRETTAMPAQPIIRFLPVAAQFVWRRRRS
jgi:hypothetical protein